MKKSLCYCIIVFLTLLTYANTLNNQFAYDDVSVIVENDFITSWDNLRAFFSRDYFNGAGEQSYRPLVTLSYFIDYQVWGKNPFGYHLTNLILHLTVLFATLMLARKFIVDQTILMIGGIIFGCHPVLTEAVCSITFREDIQSTLFFVLALWGYISFRNSNRISWFAVILPAFVFSLLAKEMGIAFIPAIGIYEVFTRKKPAVLFNFIFILTAIILIALLFFMLRFTIMNNPHDTAQLTRFNGLTACKILLAYWQLYFFPIELRALYYPRLLFHHAGDVLLCITALLIGIGYFFLLKPEKKRTALLLFLISFSLFSPVMNIYPIRHIIAERYAYMPASIFCYCLALLITTPFSGRYRIYSVAIICCILSIFSIRTVLRNSIWKHNLALWFYTAKHNPWLAEAYFSLGHAYHMRNRYTDAIKCYKKSLKENRDYVDSYINLGRLYVDQGNNEEAIAYYKIALSYQSNNPLIHYNIGIAYDNVGNDEKALAHLERCIAIEPKHYKAYNALGSFYIKRNNLKQAEYYWRKAIDVNPQFKEGYVNVGSLYANVGLTDQARYFWQKALEIDPNYETPKKHLQSLEKMLKIQN